MKLKHVILLPILLAAFYLSIIPNKTFAAEWAIIGSPEKQVRSFVVDRTNKNIIIYSDYSTATYRTENGGVNWSPVSTNPNGNCSEFLQSNQNPNEFWAGCSYGLYHSTDKGKTFNQINNPNFTTSSIDEMKQGADGAIYVRTNRGTKLRSIDGIIWESYSTVSLGDQLSDKRQMVIYQDFERIQQFLPCTDMGLQIGFLALL